MSQMSMIDEPPQANRLEWKDIEEIAGELFTVWMSGGDLVWAETAWQALAQAGMTAYSSETERTLCAARLIALAAMAREFYARAFSEGSSGEWEELVTSDLVGAYPRFDGPTLSEFIGSAELDEDAEPHYEADPASIIVELVKDEYRGVVDALMNQWGENAFFTSLYITANPDRYQDEDGAEAEDDDSSPVTAGQIAIVMDNDLDGDKLDTYQWFSQGLPL
jgi:hypothetical protein